MPERDDRTGLKVSFYLYFPAGGIGKYTDQLVTALRSFDDLDIEVVCLPEYQWAESSAYRTWPKLFSISSRVALARKIRFIFGQFINPLRLLKRAQARQSDIIHICHINYLSFPFWRKRLDRWGGKLVCSAHDIKRQKSLIYRPYEEQQLRQFYQRCDAIFVHSERQVEELEDFAGISRDSVVVVPHGPQVYEALPNLSKSELASKYQLSGEQPVALFFGFLRPEKNLLGFLQAMHLAERKDIHLLVAGNSPAGDGYISECRDAIKAYGLSDRVTLRLGYVGDDEIPQLFALADWIALPYAERFSSQSGVLNVATHYHRPVLATPTSSIGELMSRVNIGVLTDNFEVQGIANGIDRIMTELDNRPEFEFERYRQLYSWEENARITRQTYRALMRSA